MNRISHWWISCPSFTIGVQAIDQSPAIPNLIIVKTPPIARKFVRQPLANLLRWMHTISPPESVVVHKYEEDA